MACVGVVGVHAPARVRVDANRDRRALGMTRAKLGDARVRSAGVGISGIASTSSGSCLTRHEDASVLSRSSGSLRAA